MAGRTLRRVAVLVALLLVLGLAAMLVFALYGERRAQQVTQRFEAILGPPDLARFMRPEIPASENAATWLRAGAGATVLSDAERGLLSRPGRARGRWGSAETDSVNRLVTANAPALELLGGGDGRLRGRSVAGRGRGRALRAGSAGYVPSIPGRGRLDGLPVADPTARGR